MKNEKLKEIWNEIYFSEIDFKLQKALLKLCEYVEILEQKIEENENAN